VFGYVLVIRVVSFSSLVSTNILFKIMYDLSDDDEAAMEDIYCYSYKCGEYMARLELRYKHPI
jgi:hypothetical protein